MFPILQLGPFAIQLPGLFLLLGVWIGLSLAEREALRLSLLPGDPRRGAEAVYNLAFVGLVAGLVGARLAYAAQYVRAYADDPLGLVSLNPGTLAPTEGVLIGLVAAIVYGARRGLPLRATLDALAPALAVMGVALALAHLSSGDAFGAPARLPWSIFLWDDYRHPSQIYELIAALGVLGAWAGLARSGQRLPAGLNFLAVAGLSAAARIVLEAFRGDSLLLAGGVRAAQVWALVGLAACLALMRAWYRAGPAASSTE